MARAARLFDLIQALRRRRRPVAAAVLADELGVSLRTVYRDVATLLAQGFPIEGEAGLGYVLRAGSFLPPLMFETAEIDALILGLRFVMQRGDEDLGRAAADALAKVVAVLPAELADARDTTGLLAGPAGPASSPHLSVLRQAMAGESRLRLRYVDKKGAASERVIWPVVIGFFEGAEVVGAWCEARQDFRHFRLDRIEAVTPTGERFLRRHPVLLAEWRLREDLGDLF